MFFFKDVWRQNIQINLHEKQTEQNPGRHNEVLTWDYEHTRLIQIILLGYGGSDQISTRSHDLALHRLAAHSFTAVVTPFLRNDFYLRCVPLITPLLLLRAKHTVCSNYTFLSKIPEEILQVQMQGLNKKTKTTTTLVNTVKV